jgi:iron complex outermembrane receptor protein
MILQTEAQHKLSVKVQLPDGAAEGATVVLSGKQSRSGLTLPDGNFTFSNLPAGSYVVVATFAGYKPAESSVNVSGNTFVTLMLLPLPEALTPVEVKALRAGTLAPFTKTNISRTFIEKNNLGQDIPFLLNQMPNVVVNSDAGNGVGYTGIRIRGTDATRINMTINGIPYNDAESQGIFFVNLPDFLSSVSSVQIQRGVGTSSNGAGAFGASINFSTHDYRPEAYLEVNSSAGSFSTFKNTLRIGSGLVANKFTFDARLSRISSSGYIDRASSRLLGAYLNAAWYMPKSTLRLNAILGHEKTYQAWYGVTEADLKKNRRVNYAGTAKPGEPYQDEADNYWQNHYQLHYNTTFNSKLVFNTSLYLSTGQGYYEQYRAAEKPANYNLPGDNRTDLIRQLWLKNKLFGQIFSLQHKDEKNEWSAGGGWSVYPGDHFGKVIWMADRKLAAAHRWYNHDARKTDANLYAKWQRKLGKSLHAFADLQYRRVNYRLDGFRKNPNISFDEHWNFLNPKAGITYQKGQWQAYASYAMANKEPNRDDFEAGANEKPRHETLHNIEMAVSRAELLPGLQVQATGYLMYYKDQLVLTGKINDVGAYVRTNLPKSYRVGVELEAKYRRQKTSINYSLALSQNRVRNFTAFYDDYDNGGQIAVNYGNSPISFAPGIVQQATIEYRAGNRTELALISKHVGRQYLDNTGSRNRSLNPFLTNDVRCIVDLPVKKPLKQVKLVLQVNNITNVLYEPNGYTFSYISGGVLTTENFFFPMAGINWMAALNISL